jgi:hypothetical protein
VNEKLDVLFVWTSVALVTVVIMLVTNSGDRNDSGDSSDSAGDSVDDRQCGDSAGDRHR